MGLRGGRVGPTHEKATELLSGDAGCVGDHAAPPIRVCLRSLLLRGSAEGGGTGVIDLRPMAPSELHRLREIDVTEDGEFIYRCSGGEVVAVPLIWHRPPWSEAQCEERIQLLRHKLRSGGDIIGAFDGEALVGLIALRHRLTPDSAELAGLWVSRAYRRQGIARRLTGELIRLARAGGARRLYVSATESASAVGFYRGQGFTPTPEPDPELLALEPEDIHMILDLDVTAPPA